MPGTERQLSAPVARASDLDVGERLYTTRTRAADAKLSRVSAAERDTQRLLDQMRNVDVRDEVDKIYSAILDAVDGDGAATADGAPPFDVDGADLFPIAADRPRSARGTFRPHVNPLALSKLRSNTFGSAEREVNKRQGKSSEPGPGAYHREQSSFSSTSGTPRWRPASSGAVTKSRGRRGLDPNAPQTSAPGPGEYRTPSTFDEVTKPRGGKTTFGSASRERPARAASPGPGCYDLEERPKTSARGRAPFASTSPRLPKERHTSPGPTAYRAEDAAKKVAPRVPGVALPKARTNRSPSPPARGDDQPGPGQYNVLAATAIPERDAKTRGVIPRSGRETGGAFPSAKEGDAAPGPGNYDPRAEAVEPNARAAAIRGPVKQPKDPRESVPGPGSYTPAAAAAAQEQAPAFSMPKSTRFTEDERRLQHAASSPSPQSYVEGRGTALLSEHARGPTVPISTARRFDDDVTDAPGPGTYEATVPREEAGGFATTTAPRETGMVDRAAAALPGPGTYSAYEQQRDPAPSATFGTAPRDPPAPDDTPGPAAYVPQLPPDAAAGPSFGTGLRDDLEPKPQSGSVGPGDYDIAKSTFGDLNRGVSMGLPLADRDAKAAEDQPGPGTYSPKAAFPEADPAAIIGSAARFPEDRAAEELPGPGAYHTASRGADEPSARAVVIGSEKRAANSPLEAADGVGPGAYSLPSDLGKGPGPTFGSATRPADDGQDADAPGPSTYSVQHGAVQSRVQGPVFGTSPQQVATEASTAAQPGPGAYQVSTALLDPHTATPYIGTAIRGFMDDDPRPTDAPGPGAYDTRHGAVEAHSPTAHIGTAERPDMVARDAASLPGPGTYEVGRTLPPDHQAPAFGTGPQRPGDTATDVPGPGTYSPAAAATMESAPATFMPTASRMPPTQREDVPGPGAYAPDPPQELSGPAFGTAERLAAATAEPAPGPGEYTPHAAQQHVPTVVMYSAPRPHAVNPSGRDAPGPGAYTPGELPPLAQAPAFGTSTREDNADGLPRETPGPGAYDHHPQVAGERAPQVFMGTAPRAPEPRPEDANVGPGAYSPTVVVPAPHLVSQPMADRFVSERRDDQPGPGAYNPSVTPVEPESRAPTIPLASRGADGREDATKASMPGPGAYDPRNPAHDDAPAVAISFHRPSNDDVGARADVPGPGAYEVAAERGAQAPVLGTAPRVAEAPKSAVVPGPGTYNPDAYQPFAERAVTIAPAPTTEETRLARELQLLRDAPGPGAYEVGVPTESADGFTFGAASRFAEDEARKEAKQPGPGAYSPDRTAVEAAFGAPTMPKAERFAADDFSAARDAPGPGQYDTPSLPSGPTAVMLASGLDAEDTAARKHEDLPGPGQYDASHALTESRQPAHTFGGDGVRGRDDATTRDDPGPAAYDIHRAELAVMPNAPSALILGKSAADDGSSGAARDAPGPGQYDARVDARGDTGRGETRTIPRAGRDDGGDGLDSAGSGLGPAQYDTARADGLVYPAVPAAALRGRDSTAERAGVDPSAADRPGPGQYDVRSTLDPRAVVIAREARSPPDPHQDVPGPGFYATDRLPPGYGDGAATAAPGWTFGQSEARDTGAPTGMASGLGAGQYAAERAHDHVLPSSLYTTIPKAPLTNGDPPPGTGPYVGPGAYNPGPAPYEGPAFSMSNTRNAQGGADRGPDLSDPYVALGPGAYNVGTTLGGPSFKIAGRPRDTPDSAANPGPGAYNLVDYDPYRRPTVGVDMSRVSARPGLREQAAPGPGYYHLPQYLGDGRSARMHWRFVEPYYEPTPGPPDYHPSRPQPPFHKPHSEAT